MMAVTISQRASHLASFDVLAVSGAGGRSPVTPSAAGSPASRAASAARPATINFALWQNNRFDVGQSVLAKFARSQPTIKFDVQHTVADDQTRLETQFARNVAPDVFWLSAAFLAVMAVDDILVEQKLLLAGHSLSLDDSGPMFVLSYTDKGELLGFPEDWDTVAVFSTQDLFERAGLAYPTENRTRDPRSGGDLLTTAQQLTRGQGMSRQFGVIASPTAGQACGGNFARMNGGDVLDRLWVRRVVPDSPEAVTAIGWCGDLARTEPVSPSISRLSTASANRIFWSGRAAMITQGDWVPYTYQKQIGSRFRWGRVPRLRGPKGRINETNRRHTPAM